MEKIINYFDKFNYDCVDLTDENIEKILNLIDKNEVIETDDIVILDYYGLYYQTVKNYQLMLEYFKKSIMGGYSQAMFHLGKYYQNVEKNYPLMLKFYELAVNFKNKYAMNELGFYYEVYEKNYTKTKKYYTMATKYGSFISMHNLAEYY